MKQYKPLVSICCLTYNHAPFIHQCLDGFLMQKTNFEFEILIHDDASTDVTADIIREYEQKYTDIIRPIYQTENQYSKGVKISTTYNFPRAKGKYIALCEGDDYWTDPYKLQKQVDFLEANSDFSICFHNVKIRKEDEDVIVDDYITMDVSDITNIYQLTEGNYMHTASVVFRKNDNVIKDLSVIEYPIDYTIHMLNAKYGKIKKIRENMAVYRVHETGVWSMLSSELKLEKTLYILSRLIVYFERYDDGAVVELLKNRYAKTAYSLIAIYKKNVDCQEDRVFDVIKNACTFSPYYFCLEINRYLTMRENQIEKIRSNILLKPLLKLYKMFRKVT